MAYFNSSRYSQPDYLQKADPKDCPLDTVSQIRFVPGNADIVGVISWDGHFRVFELQNQPQRPPVFAMIFSQFFRLPILTFVWEPNSSNIIMGQIDGSVHHIDVQTQKANQVTLHDFAVRDIHFLEQYLLTFDVEGTMRVFEAGNQVFERAFEMDICAVAVSGRLLVITFLECEIFVGTLQEVQEERLKTYRETKNVSEPLCAWLDAELNALMVGSNEARVIVYRLASSYGLFNVIFDYAFKAHVTEGVGVATSIGHQVNCVHFFTYNRSRYILTGGGDGLVVMWNQDRKSKSFEHKGDSPVTALDYFPATQRIAVGFSYDYAKGSEGFGLLKTAPEIVLIQLREKDFWN
jgi:WD40 repeat protein